MSVKVKRALAPWTVVACLGLAGCSGEGEVVTPEPAPTTAEPSPAEPVEADSPDLADSCETAASALPNRALTSDQRLMSAAGDLEDVIAAANNVDVTFALQPVAQALYAKVTAGQGQPSVDAEMQYLAALEELDATCSSVGVDILRR